MEYGEGSRGKRFLAPQQKVEPKKANPFDVALTVLYRIVVISLYVAFAIWMITQVIN
jgi:hypothetical protein